MRAASVESRQTKNTLAARAWPLAVLVLVYLGMASAVWPAYDWPVIDSWAFGWSVKQFLETGRFVFIDWGAMSLFAHVLWGALFSLPAGFSFAALNLSTFVLSFITVVASYAALREVDFSPWQSLAGAGLLLVNPAFVLLSYSFMTDIPFLAWYSLAFWAYLRGLRRESVRWIGLGSLFAGLAVFIRQNGVVLPAAFGAYLLWRWWRRDRLAWRAVPWKEALAGALLPLAALVFLTLLSRLGVMPDRANAFSWLDASFSVGGILVTCFRLSLYMGLFALPLTMPAALFRLFHAGSSFLRTALLPAGIALLAGLGALIQFHHPFKLPYIGTWRMMPYYPAVWSIFGTGSQGEWISGTREMLFSYRFWVVITALSCVGLGLLLWPAAERVWPALGRREEREGKETHHPGWPTAFLWLSLGVFLAPLLIFRGELYERYLLGLLLPTAALFLHATRPAWDWRPARALFSALAAVYLIFSLMLTAEFIGWNGAAWRAAERLTHAGVPVEHIDGGFPWNGWHFADRVGKADVQPEDGAPAYMEVTPEIQREYVVSFSPLEGYEVIGNESYWSALRRGPAQLYILRRTQ